MSEKMKEILQGVMFFTIVILSTCIDSVVDLALASIGL